MPARFSVSPKWCERSIEQRTIEVGIARRAQSCPPCRRPVTRERTRRETIVSTFSSLYASNGVRKGTAWVAGAE
jgi:hypothetical protein